MTQRNLHSSGRQSVSFGGGLHVQRLMWALLVVEPDPVTQYTAGVLQGLEPVPVGTLLLDRADDPLDHAVLLRAVRSDELLLQAVASDQAGIAAAGEHQAIVRAQQEGLWNPPQCAEPGDQSMLQRCLGRFGPGAARELPAQQFPAVAVDDDCQCAPLVLAGPDAAQVGGPALIRRHVCGPASP